MQYALQLGAEAHLRAFAATQKQPQCDAQMYRATSTAIGVNSSGAGPSRRCYSPPTPSSSLGWYMQHRGAPGGRLAKPPSSSETIVRLVASTLAPAYVEGGEPDICAGVKPRFSRRQSGRAIGLWPQHRFAALFRQSGLVVPVLPGYGAPLHPASIARLPVSSALTLTGGQKCG